ncbi:hypothetical protein DCO56_23290 [Sphingobacterium athyrii]|uniref:Uncharacterized protein n=1 Tax=Sphingobacterium athyrii TaxID=2152717 RepID=A0A363NM28_9SPHI|nr:hypothetical protein DCO56_23290 [Sphingobacterium athyrii]
MISLKQIEVIDQNAPDFLTMQKYQLQMVISMPSCARRNNNQKRGKKENFGIKKYMLQKKTNVKSLLNRNKHIL